jgi:serine/threonine protein kinase
LRRVRRGPDGVVASKLLAGRYRIIERLGSGGMGEVFKAEDTQEENTPVAIKVLPRELAREKASVDALRREAMISKKLTHANICRLNHFDSDGDVKFLEMEYIPGQTLAELLASRPDRKLGLGELLPIAQDLAEALDYAHRETYTNAAGRRVVGVLHRDIKPANIMVTPDPSTGSGQVGRASSRGSTLIATGVFSSWVSSALNTSPIPPEPSRSMMR